MMGMMTMLRVLPPGKYDEITAMKNKMTAQTDEVRHES